MTEGRKLYRSGKDRFLGGVCGGLAEFFDWDSSLVRLAWALFSLFSFGVGVAFYILAWIIVPRNPNHGWIVASQGSKTQ